MFTMQRTYDLLFALYFVVCLEIELRKSGCLKGMVQYLNHLIHSTKVTMAVMPAFLGLLPSVGGAPDCRQRFQGYDDHGRTESND